MNGYCALCKRTDKAPNAEYISAYHTHKGLIYSCRMTQKRTFLDDRLGIERLELRRVRRELFEIKSLLANRRNALLDQIQLDKAKAPFNYGAIANEGRMLLVGEGNFSFSASIVRQFPEKAKRIYASALTKWDQATDEIAKNCHELTSSGATVLYEVDATKLEQTFPIGFFTTIVFQFPNTGSRESEDGLTANHQLICAFLRSAEKILAFNGQVVITIVDTTCYHGAFDFKRAADLTGFKLESTHPFYRSHFLGYQHCNTGDSIGGPTVSALQSYRSCTTYLFVRLTK